MDLTEEERKIIENDYLNQEMKEIKKTSFIEKLEQDKEYLEGLLHDKLKEVLIKREADRLSILEKINFEPRSILSKEDEKFLRIPILMLKDNEKNKRKLIEDTLNNIKTGKEFINYNRYMNSDFELKNYLAVSGLYIDPSKAIINEVLNLADVIIKYQDKEYRFPLDFEQSSEVIGSILLSGKEIRSEDLYPETTKIKNEIDTIKYQLK